MNSQTTLLMMIVVVTITVGGVAIFYEQGQSAVSTARQSGHGAIADTKQRQDDTFGVVSVVGYNVSNGNITYMRIQVHYEGDEALPLNSSYIQIRTDTTTATLQYRNGTTTRSVANGFYTG